MEDANKKPTENRTDEKVPFVAESWMMADDETEEINERIQQIEAACDDFETAVAVEESLHTKEESSGLVLESIKMANTRGEHATDQGQQISNSLFSSSSTTSSSGTKQTWSAMQEYSDFNNVRYVLLCVSCVTVFSYANKI